MARCLPDRERPLVDRTQLHSNNNPRKKLLIAIDEALAMVLEVNTNSTILYSLVNSWPVDRQLAAVVLNAKEIGQRVDPVRAQLASSFGKPDPDRKIVVPFIYLALQF
jgi:hypothetical protein